MDTSSLLIPAKMALHLSEMESHRFFTPFFLGENASRRQGYGLGLVIAQRILAIHGAKITYQTQLPQQTALSLALHSAFFKLALRFHLSPL